MAVTARQRHAQSEAELPQKARQSAARYCSSIRSRGVGCAYSHDHEMWIRFCPGKRLLFRLKKTIDHDRVTFRLVSPAQPRRFAIDDVRSGVYGKSPTAVINHFMPFSDCLPH